MSGRPRIPDAFQSWQIPERYEIKHLIGSGSYGQVVEAQDHEMRGVVAIKRIHRVFEDDVDCKRILRETSILKRLNHSNIIKVLDICVPRDPNGFDELYLVLELADSDLKKLFRQQVFLSELHIKTLVYNLLVGVKYIHSCGIYHRDLKPANCLINQDCTVKICDFGLARTVDRKSDVLPSGPTDIPIIPATQNQKRQLTNHVVTRWYRAPELILLQEDYDEKIDVWSVGCIFAELLGMIKDNVPNSSDRGPLFPGSHCFPLSPSQKQKHGKPPKGTDQLAVIFKILGTPNEEEIRFLEKEDARKYVSSFEKREPKSFANRFPAACVDSISLLESMLKFDPSKRISVDDALAHPLFADIRNPSLETEAPAPVKLPFDDWESLVKKQLRYHFLREVQAFHPEVEIPAELGVRRPRN